MIKEYNTTETKLIQFYLEKANLEVSENLIHHPLKHEFSYETDVVEIKNYHLIFIRTADQGEGLKGLFSSKIIGSPEKMNQLEKELGLAN